LPDPTQIPARWVIVGAIDGDRRVHARLLRAAMIADAAVTRAGALRPDAPPFSTELTS